MCHFVQDFVEGSYRSREGEEVIQLCDIQARRRALMIYSGQGAVNGEEIDQDLKYGQRIMAKFFDQGALTKILTLMDDGWIQTGWNPTSLPSDFVLSFAFRIGFLTIFTCPPPG